VKFNPLKIEAKPRHVPFVEVFFPALDLLPDGVEQTMPHNSPFSGVFMSARGEGEMGKIFNEKSKASFALTFASTA
jgi:hypothetical protein